LNHHLPDKGLVHVLVKCRGGAPCVTKIQCALFCIDVMAKRVTLNQHFVTHVWVKHTGVIMLNRYLREGVGDDRGLGKVENPIAPPLGLCC
jgi:hypothetical protein